MVGRHSPDFFFSCFKLDQNHAHAKLQRILFVDLARQRVQTYLRQRHTSNLVKYRNT